MTTEAPAWANPRKGSDLIRFRKRTVDQIEMFLQGLFSECLSDHDREEVVEILKRFSVVLDHKGL